MKRCAYCGYLIVGEAKENPSESASGARPATYWHKDAADCVVAQEAATGMSSPLRRRLSRL